MVLNDAPRRELLELRRHDEEVRTRLARDGSLFDGYVAEMEDVHVRNALSLQAILDRLGWPGVSMVGPDGSQAAWLVAQHAISMPAFQRRCLRLLRASVDSAEASPSHAAHLTDRIRFNERRPQVFGTVFDWDEEGEMSPWMIENKEGVDARRAAVGLPPLAESVARIRSQVDGEQAPASWQFRQREILEWAERSGWI